ncbi:MAG: phenylalanine--tRNA ligase subunit beta, partial [Pseudomonadota bacterium]|nr:phenylalanine--tRNA ligase subunit beta [Pseudomonadota bacterium]
GEKLEDQSTNVAGLRAGNAIPRSWSSLARSVDAFDTKADVLDILGQLGAPLNSLRVVADAPDWYQPGRSGSVRLGPKTALANFGEVHPRVLKQMDVAGPMAAFEIHLDSLPMPKMDRGTARTKLDLSPYQPVSRDFAFIVDTSVEAGTLMHVAKGADNKLITDVTVFDVFTRGALEEGQKSIAIAVTLQPTEATLTDAQIEAVSEKIIASVAKKTGGVLRG